MKLYLYLIIVFASSYLVLELYLQFETFITNRIENEIHSRSIHINYENLSFISNSSETINYVKTINNYLTENNVTIYNPKIFEKKALNDLVILIILSCSRWHKLSNSIQSIEKYNTYKYILAKYILDDCQDLIGFDNMRSKYGLNTSYQYNFINGVRNPIISLPPKQQFANRGHRSHSLLRLFLKNIYTKNETLQTAKYIFITENDWIFYEYGFIEDSFSILYGSKIWNHSVSLYTLRNTQINSKDFHRYPSVKRHDECGGETYTLNTLNDSESIPIYMSNVLGYNNKIVDYWISNNNKDSCWGGYTNNPHLQNIDQFLEKDKLSNIIINKTDINTIYGEFEMGCFVKLAGYVQAYPIYNGYVRHVGTTKHTQQHFRKRRRIIKPNSRYSAKCIPTF